MADDSIGTAILRRHIGRRFYQLRDQAGLTLEQARVALDRGRSTLGRIEAGDEAVRFREADVRDMLKLYGASEEDSKILLAMTAETRNGVRNSWWHDYTSTELPSWFTLYVSLEDSALIIEQYQPELVPGLLQTQAYAEQIIRVPADFLDDEEANRRIKARMERQSLLARVKPLAPQLKVVLNEAVLHRIAGMGDIARDQLQHLLDVSERPNVDLRVMPFSAGTHGGMASGGGFNLLHFPKDPLTGQAMEPSLAYVDSLTGAMYLTKPAEVAAYDRVWSALISKARDPHATRHAITNILEGLPQ